MPIAIAEVGERHEQSFRLTRWVERVMNMPRRVLAVRTAEQPDACRGEQPCDRSGHPAACVPHCYSDTPRQVR